MELKTSLLMLIATVGALLLLVLMMFFEIPKENAQIFLAIATLLLGFYFGSSVNKPRPPEVR